MKRINNNPMDPTYESCEPLAKLPAIEIPLRDWITYDVAESIFSFLNRWDRQSMLSVSRLWNAAVINDVRRNHYTLLVPFARFLTPDSLKKLQPFPIKEVLEAGCKKLVESTILPEIKISSENFKKTILGVLASLEEKDLKDLETQSKNEKDLPNCEHLFTLANIYRRIDENLELYRKNEENNEDNDEAYNNLFDLCVEVMALGDRSKGLATIKAFAEIYNTEEEGEVVHDILCQYLVSKDLIEEAIAVANSISEPHYKLMAMDTMFTYLLEKNLFNEALDVIEILCSYDDIKTTRLIHRFADVYKEIKQQTGDYAKADAVFLRVPLKLRIHSLYQTKKTEILINDNFLNYPNYFYHYDPLRFY